MDWGDHPSIVLSEPPVVVTDTSELRWFARGRLPIDVVTWFSHRDALATIEQRCDTYRLDRCADVGIKRRGCGLLELKVRRDVDDDAVELCPGIGGRPELWRRWSPAIGLVDVNRTDRWVDVAKTIIRRRFRENGDEVRFEPGLAGSGCCDVEIVSLIAGGQRWWSLALATYHVRSDRHDVMREAWETVTADRHFPESLAGELGDPMSYPAWVASAEPSFRPGFDRTSRFAVTRYGARPDARSAMRVERPREARTARADASYVGR